MGRKYEVDNGHIRLWNLHISVYSYTPYTRLVVAPARPSARKHFPLPVYSIPAAPPIKIYSQSGSGLALTYVRLSTPSNTTSP